MPRSLALSLFVVLASGCFMPASINNRYHARTMAAMRAGAAAEWEEKDRAMAAQGWVPMWEALEGRLQERYDEDDDVTIPVHAAGEYAILGICPRNCIDMDFVLVNSAGRRLASDLEPDARPVVTFRSGGGERLTLKVTIPDCRTEEGAGTDATWDCFYWTKVYRRR